MKQRKVRLRTVVNIRGRFGAAFEFRNDTRSHRVHFRSGGKSYASVKTKFFVHTGLEVGERSGSAKRAGARDKDKFRFFFGTRDQLIEVLRLADRVTGPDHNSECQK